MGRRGEGWVVIQIGLFILIFVASRATAGALPLWLRGIGALSFGSGAICGTLGLITLGRNLSPFPKPIAGGSLVTNGIYGVVRHPIYTGLIFGTLGWSLLVSSLLGVGMAVVLFVFFDQKTRREESWLVETYTGYAAYRGRVKKLIPWVY